MSFEPVRNGPCYIQIPAHSLSRATAFYGSVLAANIRNPEDAKSTEDRKVVHLSFGGALDSIIGAGIIKLPGTTDSETLQGGREYGWSNVYFYVSDMEASLTKVRDAGGLVLIERTLIPPRDMGWFADFRDTEGNFFGFYTDIAPKS